MSMRAEPVAARRRGTYAKGRAAKDLILQTALQVIGHKGYNATSLRDIADEVGMTQAGLLHHFDTKENLLSEVLRKRDEVDREHFSPADVSELPLIIQLAHHNMEVPGLVQLYVSLQAAATDVDHPCHEYFRERDLIVVGRIARDIEQRQAAGTFNPNVDAQVIARMLLALSDGLQAEWAINPEIDLGGTLHAFWNQYAQPELPSGPSK
ncbi:TetR/AcrR family transcriptional regulator [Pseudarthrobacter niigatensis]|uniref:AcrR family transcriptional regulator n=1 Tax=Pseudarthrobacter niigatensis TaxID=369935 RepID=A0AAJ1WFN6_9MICC|nr:TetR/AcrR family transcriptional regulator [Pseudarthrobacter niigatensis]MDQ0144643.1 AcrR family transcriptional regulator [Pseudarthrobacter niigatensis]MDQ0265289.1 AcrR family transcriptional regulator [Pseudarthrobacter niigatensis]